MGQLLYGVDAWLYWNNSYQYSSPETWATIVDLWVWGHFADININSTSDFLLLWKTVWLFPTSGKRLEIGNNDSPTALGISE